MKSKEVCIHKYGEYKTRNGRIPKFKEFLAFAEITARDLTALYGREAFAKLQRECGDDPNRLVLERTPRDKILRQYGDLALELGELPNSADWTGRGLKPGTDGLAKPPHSMKWRDIPENFSAWAKENKVSGYEDVLALIEARTVTKKVASAPNDKAFENLIKAVRSWSPARRRNSEGEYKIELRRHLESLGFDMNEEYGQSNVDLLISKLFAIETKKAPLLGEYDRLFGQLARHLQHQQRVIAVIFDVPSQDTYNQFLALVDAFLNVNASAVEVIQK